VHAICVLLLRQMATDVPSDEFLTGRVSEALEQGFALAPVGAGVEARVLNVEVRRYAQQPLASCSHEFRILTS